MKGKTKLKAQKLFALFATSTNDGESAAAYKALCKMGVTLGDVAYMDGKGLATKTIHGNIPLDTKERK